MAMDCVMIDLETLGTRPDAVFVSIGACCFDPHANAIGPIFYRRIDWTDAMSARTVDAATLKWWMQQDDAARLEIVKDGDPLQTVLSDFAAWLPDNSKVWGNGAIFDISILQHAYDYKPPWKYSNVRDVRTVVELASGRVSKDEFVREGVFHNALDDAVFQAKMVMGMWH